MILGGWGRYPRADCAISKLRSTADARDIILSGRSLIARGNGRSYGDAALNRVRVLSTLLCNRILDFDPASGRITCEAGLLLSDLLEFAVPRGFFPPVTPGTKFVTIGGMIASDVHGKNHHGSGTFCRHVESVVLMTADGNIRRCSRTENSTLFNGLCGGMGLTGLILEASFRLAPVESDAIRQETLRAANLEEVMTLLEASACSTYVVAWIDCLARGTKLGRGLVYRGEHVTRDEAKSAGFAMRAQRKRRVPFDLPGQTINTWSVRAFNEIYYRRQKPGTRLIGYEPYFYPLDAILDWNRVYGRHGLTQYQCVLPKEASSAGISAIMRRVAASGCGSPLAVLKLLGPEGEGLISFPMEGYTVALDFPVNIATLDLQRELDAIVSSHDGRLYLAKDARASAKMFRSGYPRLTQFATVRDFVDPEHKFSSLQSERLEL